MKNWTLRQRILASFAVIIAIMLLMIVAAYSRLVAIETAEEAVGTDSIPGVYYSSMIRSAWVDSYVTSQQLVGLSNHREITSADLELFRNFDNRLKQFMASYQTTIQDKDDQARFDSFVQLEENYLKIVNQVLDAYGQRNYDEAQRLITEVLTPAWKDGREHLNEVIENNRASADAATNDIVNAVNTAKGSMVVSLLLAIVAAGICGLLLLFVDTLPLNLATYALVALASLSMMITAVCHWVRGFAPARLFSLAMLVFNLGCLVVLPALLGLTRTSTDRVKVLGGMDVTDRRAGLAGTSSRLSKRLIFSIVVTVSLTNKVLVLSSTATLPRADNKVASLLFNKAAISAAFA